MSIETYRLEIRETGERDGISADLYDEDELIEATTRVSYEDYGLEPADDRSVPSSDVTEVTADVTATDLQAQRDDGGFRFRVLGDQDELLAERIDDDEWGLESG